MTHVDDIKARLAAATPGPWILSSYTSPRGARHWLQVGTQEAAGQICRAATDCLSDCSLIAHAPSDIAFLLSRVEALEAVAKIARRSAQEMMEALARLDAIDGSLTA